MHDIARDPRVEPPPARPEQQRRAASPGWPSAGRPARSQPVQRRRGRHAVDGRCAPWHPCRAPAARGAPCRRRRGRARTAPRPGCRWRRAARARPVAQRQRRAVLGSRPAASSTAAACSGPSTVGSVRCGRGEASRTPGSATGARCGGPSAVKVRAAAARRASVARLAPAAAPAASQRRSAARSSVGDVVDARQQRCRGRRGRPGRCAPTGPAPARGAGGTPPSSAATAGLELRAGASQTVRRRRPGSNTATPRGRRLGPGHCTPPVLERPTARRQTTAMPQPKRRRRQHVRSARAGWSRRAAQAASPDHLRPIPTTGGCSRRTRLATNRRGPALRTAARGTGDGGDGDHGVSPLAAAASGRRRARPTPGAPTRPAPPARRWAAHRPRPRAMPHRARLARAARRGRGRPAH